MLPFVHAAVEDGPFALVLHCKGPPPVLRLDATTRGHRGLAGSNPHGRGAPRSSHGRTALYCGALDCRSTVYCDRPRMNPSQPPKLPTTCLARLMRKKPGPKKKVPAAPTPTTAAPASIPVSMEAPSLALRKTTMTPTICSMEHLQGNFVLVLHF